MNRKICVCIMLLVMCLPTVLFADPGDFTGESPYGVTDVQVPFDDGVSFLVIAAVVYGLIRILMYRRNKKAQKQLS